MGLVVFADGDSGGVLGVPGVLQEATQQSCDLWQQTLCDLMSSHVLHATLRQPRGGRLVIAGGKDERMQNIPSTRQIWKITRHGFGPPSATYTMQALSLGGRKDHKVV